MNSVKSITVVNTTHGWAARQRNYDGSELFLVANGEQEYTMHQAQMAADNLRSHLARGGETYATTLPDNVKITK